MDNVQKHNSCINIPSSQSFIYQIPHGYHNKDSCLKEMTKRLEVNKVKYAGGGSITEPWEKMRGPIASVAPV
jgi:hypothetical protein